MQQVAWITAALLLVSAPSAGAVDGGTLYLVGDGSEWTIRALDQSGFVVRHIGRAGVILEATDADAEVLRARGLSPERLGDVGDWDELLVCYPRRSVGELERYGEIIWYERDGAALVGLRAGRVTALRSACTMAFPLPESWPLDAWLDDAPPRHLPVPGDGREAAVRGLVDDVLDAVSPDTLEAYLARLTAYPTGEPRTRYTLREECLTEGKAFIVDRLEAALPPGSRIDSLRFHVSGWDCDGGVGGTVIEYPADNIVGVLEGNGRLPGYYVVCAHYDATASHSFPDSALW